MEKRWAGAALLTGILAVMFLVSGCLHAQIGNG